MAIYTWSILVARILASVIQALVSIAVVFAIALLMGLSPNATAPKWIAAAGFLTYLTFALCCLGLAFGLAAKSVALASNGPFPLVLLPLVGSGAVAPNSMPAGVRFFAEHQPFTPMIDTLRGLLFGTYIGNSAIVALAWCTGIGVLGLACRGEVVGLRDSPVARWGSAANSASSAATRRPMVARSPCGN
jgi:ABC-2 type transport system permease protein